jgi:3-hydroxyacyl-[acyl-carrier-protein] dehydratase
MRWNLLDRIDEVVRGEYATGIKTFNLSEPLFQDHFPRFPVVPGVLILESMAQLAGKLIGYSVRLDRGDWPWPIFTMADRVKFRKFVRPGDVIQLRTSFISLREESAQMKSTARVDGRLIAQAEQTFVFNAVPLNDPADRAELEELERRALKLLWAGCPD